MHAQEVVGNDFNCIAIINVHVHVCKQWLSAQ